VATKASFNLLGGFAEFDHDFSAVNDGVNDNIYSISSRLHGDVFSKGADYCDGGGNTSTPAGKGGYCLEVDWIESNGKCGGATAIHDVPGRKASRKASRSPLGCNAAGCRKEYSFKASTIHVGAEYDAAGRPTLTHENPTITPKKWVPLPNTSNWSVTARSYAALGAVIYSSQWIGWAAAQALGCIDPHSCYFPAPGNCSAVLASSTYSVSNLEIFGTVAQGPVPTVCKADDEHARSAPLQCTAASDFPQQTTFHAFNPDAAGHTAHLNDANAIFEYRSIYHIMAQHGGGNWSHHVSNDLVRWWSLPDALDGNASSSWDQDTCDGVVSLPNLGRAPYNGSTPVMLYGPDCGKKLPPAPSPGGSVGNGDYPSVAVALPAHGGADVHLTKWTASSNPVSFDGVPCSFPGRVWKSAVGARWNMLCAWDGRGPWSLFSTTDATLLTGWKLADKAFATDASGAVPKGGGAGALFHRIPGGGGDLYTFNTGTGDRFAVGRYDAKAEKLALLSDADGKAKQYVLDYGVGYSGGGIGGYTSGPRPASLPTAGCSPPRGWTKASAPQIRRAPCGPSILATATACGTGACSHCRAKFAGTQRLRSWSRGRSPSWRACGTRRSSTTCGSSCSRTLGAASRRSHRRRAARSTSSSLLSYRSAASRATLAWRCARSATRWPTRRCS